METFIRKTSVSRFYIDLGAQISAANYKEYRHNLTSSAPDITTSGDTTTITTSVTESFDTIRSVITVPGLFVETGVNIRGADNFGFHFSNRFLWNYNPQTLKIRGGDNRSHLFLRPSVEMYYNPFGDPSGRIFARLNYWIDTKNLEANKDHFFQFQAGYNTTLSRLRQGIARSGQHFIMGI